MKTIEFHAMVDQEQVIRPQEGVTLPPGEVEVTVRSRQPEPDPTADSLAPTRAWLLELAAEAEKAAPHLPSDMAEAGRRADFDRYLAAVPNVLAPASDRRD